MLMNNKVHIHTYVQNLYATHTYVHAYTLTHMYICIHGVFSGAATESDDTFSSSSFSSFGKLPAEDFEKSWARLVKPDGTGLKISARSYRTFPLQGTSKGAAAAAARLAHTWNQHGQIIELLDKDISIMEGATSSPSHPGTSILFHTGGFYQVKVSDLHELAENVHDALHNLTHDCVPLGRCMTTTCKMEPDCHMMAVTMQSSMLMAKSSSHMNSSQISCIQLVITK